MLLSKVNVGKLIDSRRIVELPGLPKDAAITELCRVLATDARVRDGEALRKAMLQREAMSSTGIGVGLAIPHVKIPQVSDFVLAIGRCRKGIEYDSLDQQPVHLIFMVAASDQQTRPFIHVLARISEVMRHDCIRQELLATPDLETFYHLIRQYEW